MSGYVGEIRSSCVLSVCSHIRRPQVSNVARCLAPSRCHLQAIWPCAALWYRGELHADVLPVLCSLWPWRCRMWRALPASADITGESCLLTLPRLRQLLPTWKPSALSQLTPEGTTVL